MKLPKSTLGWMFYDFANSAFTTVIVTVVFSVYFANHVVLEAGKGEWLWGLAVSISMTLAAITAPILGAVADYSHAKKKLLFFFAYMTVIFTCLLYFVKPGYTAMGMVFFILANYAFNSANVFYDAFLPEVSTPETIGKVSGYGWALGYLGGLVSLVVSLFLVKHHVRLVFPMIGLHFLVFSLLTLFMLKEKQAPYVRTNYLKVAFTRLVFTFKHISRMPQLLRYLLSYFIYNNGIYTVIIMAAIFGKKTFGMSDQNIIMFFVIAQITSLIGAAGFGYLSDRLNVKTSLSISLLIWLGVVGWAFFSKSATEYYLVGLIAGLAIGSSQANSRTMMSLLTPTEKQAEFFGFYTLMGRLSAILGPFLYGLISMKTGSQRFSILSLIVFFILGWILLQSVSLKKGQAQSREIEVKEQSI
jgi:MFS transporter, UMF1 family